MKAPSIMLSMIAAVTAASCSPDTDRFEDVQKLRGLGVASKPAVAAPSTDSTPSKVKLTFYAAIPSGDPVTATTFVDQQGTKAGLPADLELDQSSAKTASHSALDIFQIDGTLTIPPAGALTFIGAEQIATVHFGVQLTSQAHGTQLIVGKTVVYQTGAAGLTTLNSAPQVAIASPAKGAALAGSQDLRASDSTASAETLRIGWFVNGGEIKNPASGTTTWDPKKTKGAVTLIVTARGAKSGAFALDVIDLTVD